MTAQTADERFDACPQSLLNCLMNIEEMQKTRAIAKDSLDESRKETYELAVAYWKKNIIRSANLAFKLDNTLRFADLDWLAAEDPDVIECFRIALKED